MAVDRGDDRDCGRARDRLAARRARAACDAARERAPDVTRGARTADAGSRTARAGEAPTKAVKPRGNGRLKVNLSPYAEVSLDGRPLGTTPIDESVRAGEHTIELYNPDSGLRRRLDVTIRDGRTHDITRW
jgi:hypothetical protein